MYKQYLKVQDCKAGKGLFTTINIPAKSPIIEITGPIAVDKESNRDSYIQVGPNTFIGQSGDVDDYINHSCDPNCKLHIVGNRAILYSLYIVPAGNELNIDYSITSTATSDEWQMECKCGSIKCRKIVSGHHYLSEEIKTDYLNKGMLPLYITSPSLIKKR